MVFAGTRYSLQLPGKDSDSIKSGFVSALALVISTPVSLYFLSPLSLSFSSLSLSFSLFPPSTVRSGAEERTFSGARLDVLIFRLRSYHVLNLVYCRC